MAQEQPREIVRVKIDEVLIVKEDNARDAWAYSKKNEEFVALLQGVAKNGIIEPPTLIPIVEDREDRKKYKITAGFRRTTCGSLVQKARRKKDKEYDFEFDAIIRKDIDASKTEEIQLETFRAQIQNVGFTLKEQAQHIKKLLDGGITVNRIALETGLTEVRIKRLKQIANLPDEVQEIIAEGDFLKANLNKLAETYAKFSGDEHKKVREKLVEFFVENPKCSASEFKNRCAQIITASQGGNKRRVSGGSKKDAPKTKDLSADKQREILNSINKKNSSSTGPNKKGKTKTSAQEKRLKNILENHDLEWREMEECKKFFLDLIQLGTGFTIVDTVLDKCIINKTVEAESDDDEDEISLEDAVDEIESIDDSEMDDDDEDDDFDLDDDFDFDEDDD